MQSGTGVMSWMPEAAWCVCVYIYVYIDMDVWPMVIAKINAPLAPLLCRGYRVLYKSSNTTLA